MHFSLRPLAQDGVEEKAAGSCILVAKAPKKPAICIYAESVYYYAKLQINFHGHVYWLGLFSIYYLCVLSHLSTGGSRNSGAWTGRHNFNIILEVVYSLVDNFSGPKKRSNSQNFL